MATIKAYTDISQSKKLAKILPLESADMHWQYIEEDNGQLQWFCFPKDFSINQHNTVSAWSLAALLDILRNVADNIDEDGSVNLYSYKNVEWGLSMDYTNIGLIYNSNHIDACYEMIIKLHEQKLL
jgi:hypothetical protein